MDSAEPAAAESLRSLRECPDCGLFQHLGPLPRGTVARCRRCRAVLARSRVETVGRALPLLVAGLVLFAIATQFDFVSLSLLGLHSQSHLITGPEQLQAHGLWEVAIVVLVTTIAAPVLRLGLLAYVTFGLQMRPPLPGLRAAFRWNQRLAPWSMIEIFLLGLLVAYTRLGALADVTTGPAVWALGGLMVTQIAADATLDRESMWWMIAAAAPLPAPVRHDSGRLIGCRTCHLVSDAAAECPRCGARLRRRKPASLGTCAALLLSAAMLYVPANAFPVLSYTTFGRISPATILSGVSELATSGLWPLALLVFFASITVPVLKVIVLTYLLITTRRGSTAHLRTRTQLYRIVDGIGRWSMIDVFVVSILTALVRLGVLASVDPGPGAIAFCAVVILTMFAAISFDPRLMWDPVEP